MLNTHQHRRDGADCMLQENSQCYLPLATHTIIKAANTIIFCFYGGKCWMLHTRWRPQQVTKECPSQHPHTTKYLVLMLLQTRLLSHGHFTIKNSFEEPGLLFFCTSRGLQDLSVDTTHNPHSFSIRHWHQPFTRIKNKKSMEGHYRTLPTE
jgi:hypothetical protein